MIALPNLAANLAQTEDIFSNYALLVQSEAQLGLALSGKPSWASDWARQAYFVTASSFWAKLAARLDKTIMIYLSIDRRSQSKLIFVAVFM